MTYTLSELTQRTDRDYFTAEEVSGVLGMDPHTIRIAARQRPDLLGFPTVIANTRVRIPRIPFLRFMGVIV